MHFGKIGLGNPFVFLKQAGARLMGLGEAEAAFGGKSQADKTYARLKDLYSERFEKVKDRARLGVTGAQRNEMILESSRITETIDGLMRNGASAEELTDVQDRIAALGDQLEASGTDPRIVSAIQSSLTSATEALQDAGEQVVEGAEEPPELTEEQINAALQVFGQADSKVSTAMDRLEPVLTPPGEAEQEIVEAITDPTSENVSTSLEENGVVHMEIDTDFTTTDPMIIEHDDAMALEEGTIEMTVNLDSTKPLQVLFSKNVDGETADGDMTVYVDNGRLYAFLQNDGQETRLDAGKISKKKDVTISLTFGDGNLAIYVDGEKKVEGAAPGGLTGNTQDLYIGGYERDGDVIFETEGTISDVVIHNTILSEQEIEERGSSADLTVTTEVEGGGGGSGGSGGPQSRADTIYAELEIIHAELSGATAQSNITQIVTTNHTRLTNLLAYIDETPNSDPNSQEISQARGQVNAAIQKLKHHVGEVSEGGSESGVVQELAVAKQAMNTVTQMIVGKRELEHERVSARVVSPLGEVSSSDQGSQTARQAGYMMVRQASAGSKMQFFVARNGEKISHLIASVNEESFVSQVKDLNRSKREIEVLSEQRKRRNDKLQAIDRQAKRISDRMATVSAQIAEANPTKSTQPIVSKAGTVDAVQVEAIAVEKLAQLEEQQVSEGIPGRIDNIGLDMVG